MIGVNEIIICREQMTEIITYYFMNKLFRDGEIADIEIVDVEVENTGDGDFMTTVRLDHPL